MKLASCCAPRSYPCKLNQSATLLALVLSVVAFASSTAFAQQAWGQTPQYAGSPYIQPNPNYVSNAQAKPTPYQYPEQIPPQQDPPAQNQYGQQQSYPQQQQDAQPYGEQPQQQYAQPSYGQQQPYQSPQQDSAPEAYVPRQDPAQMGQPQSYAQQPQQGQAFAADQLEQLVAPIALYPDNLVAQILAASTYPAQVAAADNWLRSQPGVDPNQVAYAASSQTGWDPSVKALTAFPQVLAMMDHDLRWTTDLGNAYYNQPQDVLQTIQVMRQRAQAAGTLQNTPQEQVSDNQGYIQLAPANPQVVYVPTYNPWVVYGQPVAPYPGFSLLNAFGAVASVLGEGLRFGGGIGLAAFSNTPFGWAGWALNWLASAIFFNHSPYYSHSGTVAHWGGGYGGREGGINRRPSGFDRPQQAYGREGNRYGEQAFNRPQLRNPAESYGNLAFDGRAFQEPNRPLQTPNRGYGNSYVRPALPGSTYNRPQQQAMLARPEPYTRQGGYGSANGSSFYGNGSRTYGGGYGVPQRYAAGSSSANPRNDIAQRGFSQSRAYASDRSFASAPRQEGVRQQSFKQPKQESFRSNRSGGSHLFGGGHGGGSFHAPKAPKMSGGGHHGGGLFHHGR